MMTMIVMVRMRAKLCFFACILFTVGFLVISDHKQQSIKTIVQETQNQLDNLKKNFKDVGKLLVVDSKYMEKLMKTSIDDDLANATFSSVVILTAVVNGRAGEAVHFVRNAHLFMPNLTVIIYDLGLSGHESSLVNTYCNESCHLIKFDPDGFYPVHVRKFSRPVIIQETLKVATHSVIYMDIDQRFVTKDISTFLYNCSRMGGISAWLRDDYNIPTSALTHPKMFEYLVDDKDQVDNFNFQHMITARVLVINKSTEIMEKVVRHWAECALLQDCVEPIGSQSTGCRFDKKPKYRYSGCHDYDVSALNVLLGVMFQFDESRYIMSDKFFATVTDEDNYHSNRTYLFTNELSLNAFNASTTSKTIDEILTLF